MTLWSSTYVLASPCLAVGRLTTCWATTFPPTSTCTTQVTTMYCRCVSSTTSLTTALLTRHLSGSSSPRVPGTSSSRHRSQ
uniref:Putative secreted protein n=1 Tax=Ixodes scapularis TaxID=6945 RepID=A0A4D5RBJ4_IXOSC